MEETIAAAKELPALSQYGNRTEGRGMQPRAMPTGTFKSDASVVMSPVTESTCTIEFKLGWLTMIYKKHACTIPPHNAGRAQK
jgi:hypothetical protein